MAGRHFFSISPIFALALAALAASFPARPAWCADAVRTASPPRPRAESQAPPGFFHHRDLLMGLVAAGAVTVSASCDVLVRHEVQESHSPGELQLADHAERLGNSGLVLGVIAGAYVGARAAHRPALASSALRVGTSVGAASVGAQILKRVVGRSRPSEDHGDRGKIQPFSSHDSFPSGHSAVAFSLATAIDRETSDRWTPWIAYPAAALLGWSRVRDDRHWTSDVIAGAALGIWTAWKVEDCFHPRSGRALRLGWGPVSGGAGLGLYLTL